MSAIAQRCSFVATAIECALDKARRLSSEFFSGVPEGPGGDVQVALFAARPLGHAAKKFKNARLIQSVLNKPGPPIAADSGFTLVEILIVVIILGILAAVVVPQFSSASQDSRNSALKSQLQTVRSAIEVYQMQHMDQLPDLSTSWTPLMTQTNPQGGTTGAVLVGPYLPIVPVNALTGGSSLSTAAAAGVDWVWNPAAGTLTALDPQGNAFSETP